MQTSIKIAILFLLPFMLHAQYEFSKVKTISCTDVKSQDRTGTCWSFATSSFLESELLRQGVKNPDLSEMFTVRNIYVDKAMNYVYRQGKANFSQGSLGHDVLRSYKKFGAVPESAFSGMYAGQSKHNHGEMERVLKGMLDGVIKSKNLSSHWRDAVDAVLDVYLGEVPSEFEVNGKKYTPKSYAKSLNINPDDYVSISSFTHHPFYESFILEIPDNYSNGQFYNVPLDDMMAIIDYSLEQGISLSWDGDVSEKGFSARQGIAVLPEDADREDLYEKPGAEQSVNQTNRQEGFESFATTDDHLMHLVGAARDQKGTKYYLIKNSWGEISDYKGYLYMSRPYVQMKTMAIMVHKDGIPKSIRKKLGI